MTEEEFKAEIERRDEIIASNQSVIDGLRHDLDLEIQKGRLRVFVWEQAFFFAHGLASRKTP